jgi:DNA (cytosine-5)-methyltransferase 1
MAHLKNDGLMFIHPTQTRSLTPREAARIQSFPDTFKFSGHRSHVFTQIGNAVPPLVGRSVGHGIVEYLGASARIKKKSAISESRRLQLLSELEQFVNNCWIHPICFVDDDEFKKVWLKIHLLLPNLHPESARDNGSQISSVPKRNVSFCLEPFFIRSGWPVELAPIAQEACNRHDSGRLHPSDYFHA